MDANQLAATEARFEDITKEVQAYLESNSKNIGWEIVSKVTKWDGKIAIRATSCGCHVETDLFIQLDKIALEGERYLDKVRSRYRPTLDYIIRWLSRKIFEN